MAASSVRTTLAIGLRRRPLVLTQRRIEANRRNAARSTGPRTAQGKARVARNPIKHAFFVAPEKWSPGQRRDFAETLDGLRDDLRPQGVLEEGCVTIMAQSYVRMAAMLRYENIAALKYHQERERELNQRIVAAEAPQAAQLQAQRDQLIAAGLWGPTIPGPREARAIIRYGGSLDRAIRRASSDLRGLQQMRVSGAASIPMVQKQTHYSAPPNSVLRLGEGPQVPPSPARKVQKQTHLVASPNIGPEPCEGPRVAPPTASEDAKTNPLSSMFMGNRHQRRRAKALAARRR
jgi:hypothetical protein